MDSHPEDPPVATTAIEVNCLLTIIERPSALHVQLEQLISVYMHLAQSSAANHSRQEPR